MRNRNDIQTSLTSRIVFFMICAIPIFACILFGAVSTITLFLLTILVGILLIAWYIDIWNAGEVKIGFNLLTVPFFALIAIGLVQLLPLGFAQPGADLLSISSITSLSIDPSATRFAVVKLIIFLVFFVLALAYIDSPERLKKATYTIVVFAAVMSFLGILQRLASPNFIYGMREVDYAQPFASYVNQHHFAAFMEMSIGLTLGLLFSDAVEKDKRLLLIIAVVLMGIAIILTGSRGGFISLIGVIAFLIFFALKFGAKSIDKAEVKKRNLALIGGSIALVLVLLASAIWLGKEESVSRGIGATAGQMQDFSTGRIDFWKNTLKIIRDNPVLGTGLESFGVAYTKYDTGNGKLRLEQAHNDYLQILSDAGILGFVCVIAFVFLLFRLSLRVIKSSGNRFRTGVAIGALAGCFGILIHSLFDFPLRTNANMFFFLLLAALATVSIDYPKLYRKRVKKS